MHHEKAANPNRELDVTDVKHNDLNVLVSFTFMVRFVET